MNRYWNRPHPAGPFSRCFAAGATRNKKTKAMKRWCQTGNKSSIIFRNYLHSQGSFVAFMQQDVITLQKSCDFSTKNPRSHSRSKYKKCNFQIRFRQSWRHTTIDGDFNPDREFIAMITWEFLPALLVGSGGAATAFGCVCMLADESRRNRLEPLRALAENVYPNGLHQRGSGLLPSATGRNSRLPANAVVTMSIAAAKVAPVIRTQDARAQAIISRKRQHLPAAAMR
jgi:hypothetical protein